MYHVTHTNNLRPNAYAQVTHSLPWWSIPAVLAANSISLLLYNVAGMFVTDELGAVSRTVFESARTLFVWLVRSPFCCPALCLAHT